MYIMYNIKHRREKNLTVHGQSTKFYPSTFCFTLISYCTSSVASAIANIVSINLINLLTTELIFKSYFCIFETIIISNASLHYWLQYWVIKSYKSKRLSIIYEQKDAKSFSL